MAEDKPKRGVPFYYQVASILLLLILVGFSISGLWGVTKIVAPGITTWDFEYRQTLDFESFAQEKLKRVGDRYVGRHMPSLSEQDTLARADAESLFQAARQRALAAERRGGVQQVIYWLIAVLVCLPTYLYHAGVVRQARHQGGETGCTGSTP